MRHTLDTCSTIVFLIAAATPPALADVVWTGVVSNHAFDDANWDFSSSTLTAIDPNVTIHDDVVIEGALVGFGPVPSGTRLQLGAGRELLLRAATLHGTSQLLTSEPGSTTGATVRLTDDSRLTCWGAADGIALEVDGTSVVVLNASNDPFASSTCDVTRGAIVRLMNVTPASFAAQHVSKFTVDHGPVVLGQNLVALPYSGQSGCEVLATAALGTHYCWSNPTGTGLPSTTQAYGSSAVADDDVLLVCSGIPINMFTFFLTSQTRGFVPNAGGSPTHISRGNLCLGGAVGRFVGAGQIMNSGPTGVVQLRLDLARHPTPTGLMPVLAGETWNFQCWHRDQGAVSTSNFSDAIEVVFR